MLHLHETMCHIPTVKKSLSSYLRSHAISWFVSLLSVLGMACEEPLRLPYIEPTLHNWPQPYRGVTGLKLHVFHTGSIELPSRIVYESGSLPQRQTLAIVVFGLEHPKHGLVLVGTGLNRGMAEDAQRYLGQFRAALGQATMHVGQDILAQLSTAQLLAESVKLIVMPDLRLDHAGELESFPNASIVVTRAEHATALSSSSIGLYMPSEFDQVPTWQFVDFTDHAPLGTFANSHDLFGDGSVELIDVTAATAGGLAVLIRLPNQPVMLCGNLAWTESQARYAWTPGLAFNREAWWETIWRLKKFKDLVPALKILPDHDWAAIRKAESSTIVVHEFSPSEEDEGQKPANDAPTAGIGPPRFSNLPRLGSVGDRWTSL